MVGAITGDFMKRFMDRTNRARETSGPTVYDSISKLGALNEARKVVEG